MCQGLHVICHIYLRSTESGQGTQIYWDLLRGVSLAFGGGSSQGFCFLSQAGDRSQHFHSERQEVH